MGSSYGMGERIRHQLEVKNLNQSDLARRLRVSRVTVSQWRRDVSVPRPAALVSLAELLFDGDIHYLVFGPAREPAGGFPFRRASTTSAPRRRSTT